MGVCHAETRSRAGALRGGGGGDGAPAQRLHVAESEQHRVGLSAARLPTVKGAARGNNNDNMQGICRECAGNVQGTFGELRFTELEQHCVGLSAARLPTVKGAARGNNSKHAYAG